GDAAGDPGADRGAGPRRRGVAPPGGGGAGAIRAGSFSSRGPAARVAPGPRRGREELHGDGAVADRRREEGRGGVRSGLSLLRSTSLPIRGPSRRPAAAANIDRNERAALRVSQGAFRRGEDATDGDGQGQLHQACLAVAPANQLPKLVLLPVP